MMPRFDVYRNPNPQASHTLYLDVQSDLVTTATRWCIPLYAAQPGQPVMQRAQTTLRINRQPFVLDAPNILAVPARLLRNPVGHLTEADRAIVDSSIDFMLRGW